MAGTATAKRKAEEARIRSRPKNKKFKKQKHYSSGSEDEDEEKITTSNGVTSTKSRAGTSALKSSKKASAKEPSEDASTSEESDGEDAGEEKKTEDKRVKFAIDEKDDDDVFNGGEDTDDNGEQGDGDSNEDEEETDFDSDEDGSGSGSGSEADPEEPKRSRKTKKSDPAAFAASMGAILGSKLSGRGRADPVLARSRAAAATAHSQAEAKLEERARRKLRAERRVATDRARVRDVLLDESQLAVQPATEIDDERQQQGDGTDGVGSQKRVPSAQDTGPDGASAALIAEQERRLRKTAQRGVVKLFNAVRAAQVRGEQAARDARAAGLVGAGRREERVRDMGSQAFLDMVGAGKLDAS